MVKIVQRDHQILRQIALEVPPGDITSPKIQKVISDMKKAMDKEDDAVAIAAPQIGESLRIFLISRKIFEIMNPEHMEEKKYKDQVFINPKITKISKDRKLVEEGCLSIRYAYGKIRRSTKATVVAYNEKGEKFERGGSGLLAQIFQHETDHLNGKLFTDTAVDVKEMPPEKKTKKSSSQITN